MQGAPVNWRPSGTVSRAVDAVWSGGSESRLGARPSGLAYGRFRSAVEETPHGIEEAVALRMSFFGAALRELFEQFSLLRR